MSALVDDALAEARLWLGTPYRHQASCCQAGADCLGLLRGVWRALYGREPQDIPTYTPDWSEPQGEETLWDGAERHMISKPMGDIAAGDVLLFRMREGSVAKHVGILSSVSPGTFIHSYSKYGVVESPFSEPWAHRLVACFAFPEISDVTGSQN
ncbi:NlpC/P60 family protein [Litoreibacter roseus]|uniref:Peptidase n=1 Tax=Litoreibacter roseus TaxID=2601869 RepID=A0A6N6JLE5_9RHOB|nr:NlpC/P60 family protein [Litoreibacter roseus]GFE66700.1 peptidase [Litoreibacter roseus]